MSKKMRMMILFGILFGMVTICVNPVLGFDPNGFKDWTVTAYGSDDLLGVRAGLRPWAGRAELGLFGMWMDGLSEGDVKSDTESNQQESWGLGVYATYDVVQRAEFTVLSYQIPIDIYVGGQLGALHRADSDEDATAALMTGLTFGDGGVQLGVEYQYGLDEELWKELAPLDDNHRLLLTLGIRF
jgi:hypothetical protein